MQGLLSRKIENVSEEYYGDSWEHIQDEMRLLDMRIQACVSRLDDVHQNEAIQQFKGLAISKVEIDKILENESHSFSEKLRDTVFSEEISSLQQEITKKVRNSIATGMQLPLFKLSEIFHLTEFERLCVISCFAVEVNKKYETLFAYLNDDMTQKLPTVKLIMDLLNCKEDEIKTVYSFFEAQASLNRYLLQPRMSQENATFISEVLKLNEYVIAYVLGTSEIDENIRSFAQAIYPEAQITSMFLGESVQNRLVDFADKYFINNEQNELNTVFYLHGPHGSGRKTQAKHFCKHYNQPLLIVDINYMLKSGSSFELNLRNLEREAVFMQGIICFDSFELLLDENQNKDGNLHKLLELLRNVTKITFLNSTCSWKPKELMDKSIFIDIELGIPSDNERRLCWQKTFEESKCFEQINFGELAGKFRFTPGQIKSAFNTARTMADFLNQGELCISEKDIYSSCYTQASHHLEEMGTRIIPRYGMDDIILPEDQKQQLINICNQVKYRYLIYGDWGFDRKLSYGKGISTIFSGPPGTGKTMSAEVIAKELKLELYKIDLSQTVSKYIGETEKNLHNIFTEAQSSNAILFFDEADALFGKRSEVKEAKDRYANIETAYLLQKVEEYEGVTILATNFNGNIDDAFIRRMQYIVEFPFPNAEYREKIWRTIFPLEAPLSEDVDFEFLAERFEVSGGNIKNIVVSAAFLAANQGREIGMEHIIKASKYELKKMGKILLKEDLGEYY